MSPEAQRIAIAEACGWMEILKLVNPSEDKPLRTDCWLGYLTHNPDEDASPVPDYLSDLNAMHEAEKVLTIDQACDYLVELEHAANARGFEDSTHAAFRLAHATAAQRAEAFLRTIGKWEEVG